MFRHAALHKQLLADLNSSWRTVDAPTPSHSDDGCWVHTLEIVIDGLGKPGLSIHAPKH